MKKSNKSFQKFLILWVGEFISAIGGGLTAFGLGVYVYHLTGKASAMAIITLLAFLPPLLLSSVAGVLADRYDRRLMMILGDSLSVFGLIFILGCMIAGNPQMWQICLGVAISSVFSSLMDPAYKATVTDLLTEEEFTRAIGMMQITDSAKYLVSPIIAGFLLSVSDIKIILIIDIATFFVTVATTMTVRKVIVPHLKVKEKSNFRDEFRVGWMGLTEKKGIFALVIVGSFLTLFMGVIQVLSLPMILSFSNSSVLGTIESLIACGMLVSSICIGMVKITSRHVELLCLSLFVTGLMMIGFAFRENLYMIGIFGFLFFACLPFSNTCLDYLIRTNTANEVQGRVWSLVGIISQLGYVLAYGFCGLLSDYIFTPMLQKNGVLAGTVGVLIGTGQGRGAAFLIIIAGLLMCITAFILYQIKSVRALENRKEAIHEEDDHIRHIIEMATEHMQEDINL